jgi:hypothetical protein
MAPASADTRIPVIIMVRAFRFIRITSCVIEFTERTN